MISVRRIDTTSLGDRSYVATDGDVAVVIDPQRDIDRVLGLTTELRVRITHVAETHIHNDYVTGGLQLAREAAAEYIVAAADDVSFARRGVGDGDLIEAGGMRLRVVHTPGHTFTHVSYVLEDDAGGVAGVFTGGSVLFGSTGRTDLLGARHAESLARRQFASAHRLARELPDRTPVYPTHGFGSFCSSAPADGRASSTLAREALVNPVFVQDESRYVTELLAGLTPYPAYYAHMARLNRRGPSPVDLRLPQPEGPADLLRRLAQGEWVVDVRDRSAFAAGHLPGALNFGLDSGFASHLGWLVPWGTPVSLLGETASDVAAAQRELVRIGIDRPAAVAIAGGDLWGGDEMVVSYRRVTFADLARVTAREASPYVLDVRRSEERAGGAVDGSVHLPLHELPERVDEIPADRPVWVHCRVGYRASIAVSLLARAGRDVVLIDDDTANIVEYGVTTDCLGHRRGA